MIVHFSFTYLQDAADAEALVLLVLVIADKQIILMNKISIGI